MNLLDAAKASLVEMKRAIRVLIARSNNVPMVLSLEKSYADLRAAAIREQGEE